MKISTQTYNVFMQTLEQSRADGMELGSFGLYTPTQSELHEPSRYRKGDGILHVIPPHELPESSIVSRTETSLAFNSDLIQEVRAFNDGRKNSVQIGSYTYDRDLDPDVKIIGYHTHPLNGHRIAPSKEDALQVGQRNSPLEVVIAGALASAALIPHVDNPELFEQEQPYSMETLERLKKLKELPFVAGYTGEYVPGGLDFGTASVFGNAEKEVEDSNLSIEVINQLMNVQSTTGLYPSIDFWIDEKGPFLFHDD